MPQDQFGDQVSVPLPLAIAIGAFGAAAPPIPKADRRTGYTLLAVTANTFADLRPGTFAQQASSATRSIVSSNANDNSAGTGARTVTINYLDDNMVLKSTVATMNGTTPVDLGVSDVRFVESLVVASVGTGLQNAGDISLKAASGGGGATIAQILSVSPNNSFYCHHYVPAGVTCYVLQHSGSGTLAVGRPVLYALGDPRSSQPSVQIGDIFVHLAGGTWDNQYEAPLIVPGPNVILARELPVTTTANNVAYAGFDFLEF